MVTILPAWRLSTAPGKPIGEEAKFDVAADRGWQSSGVRVEAGHHYRVTASGRYQVAEKPRVWQSEPGGVTIEYYHGRPLGVLLATVRPDHIDVKRPSALVKPIVVGLEATISPTTTGTLYFRINDSAAKLADNSGVAKVVISEVVDK